MFYSFVRLEVFLLYLLNIVICSLKYLFIKKNENIAKRRCKLLQNTAGMKIILLQGKASSNGLEL